MICLTKRTRLQLLSKVIQELRIFTDMIMSFLHKVQVNRRSTSVQTEKVKLQGKKEVGASNQIGLQRPDSSATAKAKRKRCFLIEKSLLFALNQSHYREVARWEIFMEQELRFGLDLGRFGNF